MTAGVRTQFGGPHEPVPKSYSRSVVDDFLRAVTVPGTTFSTLAIFAEALEQNSEELVREIVQRSTGTEVASLLNNAHKLKSADIALIFTVLEKIIITVASELEGRESFALELSEILITKQMKTFYYMLKTSNKSNQIKSALKLLIAMCALGQRTVKMLLANFSFVTSNFSSLVSRRNTVDPQDVRTCALHFIVAVLMFGDNVAVRTLLEAKNVVSALFPGLIVDRSQLIHLLLSTLLDRVVNNVAISKTLKIHLFNQTSLKQICRVFSWNGHKKSEKEFVEDDLAAKSNQEERSAIKDDVLRFLTAVCSSVKFGIVFQDPSFGTSTKNHNHILTELLRTLTVSSAYHRELARVILVAAADQMVHFLPTWKPGFVPRASENWTDIMSWLRSIYADWDVARMVKKLSGKTRVSYALVLVVPSIMDREMQAEAFAEKQPITVALTFLKFVHDAVMRVHKISLVLTSEEKQLFLRESMEKLLSPDIVATALQKFRHLPNSKPSDMLEFVSYLVLDSIVFSRELPALVAAELSSAVQTTRASLTAELAKISENMQVSEPNGVSEFSEESPAVEAARVARRRKDADKVLATATCVCLMEGVKKDRRMLNTSLMEILLGAYRATLSEADQCIFDIIREAELTCPEVSSSISFATFGRNAQQQQAQKAKQGVALVPSQPTIREFVDGLDSSMIYRTARDFPIRLPLNGSLITKLIMDSIYDPRYILSNFAVLLATPSTPFNIQHFVDSGSLGLIIRAMSSLDRDMRAAAGFCLRGITARSGSLRFKGREQLLYVLDLVRRRNYPEKAWPSLWTVFLSRFFGVMFDGQDHTYQVMMEFLLVKPDLVLDIVPEFYKLFESGNLTHGKERKLILEVIRDGMHHHRDYELCQKSHAWEIMLSYMASPLSNPAIDILISEVLLAASWVPFVGRALVKTHGFFTRMTYLLASTDSPELIGNLTVSAAHCLHDLLRAKRRTAFDAGSLARHILHAFEGQATTLAVAEAILVFISDLLLFSSSEESLYLFLTPKELNAAVTIGLQYLRFSRRNLEIARWRNRCRLSMMNIKVLNRHHTSSSLKVHVLQKFLSDLTGSNVLCLSLD